MKFNRTIPLVAAGILLVALSGCKGKGGDKGTKIPEEYTVGEATISALVVYDDVTVTEEASEGSKAVTYLYEGVKKPGATVDAYVAQLLDDGKGFVIVDEQYQKSEAPDFQAEEGSVWLARESAQEGKLLTISLKWTVDTCTVVLDVVDDVITEEPQGMTLMEATDYFRGLPPSALRLSGNSMHEYNVYVLDGLVLVNQRPCMQIRVYCDDNPVGTNELIGMYLMTSDGKTIYRMENGEDELEKMNISG